MRDLPTADRGTARPVAALTGRLRRRPLGSGQSTSAAHGWQAVSIVLVGGFMALLDTATSGFQAKPNQPGGCF